MKKFLSGLVFGIVLLAPLMGEASATGYQQAIAELVEARATMARRYADAADEADRQRVLSAAREIVLEAFAQNLLSPWLGTSWSYNGVSRTPGQGSIACGAFVIIVLQHAGFSLPTRMLRQPSENIIRNLTLPSNIRRYSNSTPVSRVIAGIRRMGEGLYMVGLDLHVGLILYRDGRITFWHSTYFPPVRHVVAQEIHEYSPFTISRYRVVGKLLGDGMLRKWLAGEGFEITHDYFRRTDG